MKLTYECLLSVLVIAKISSAAVPAVGQFIFTSYSDSTCKNSNRQGAGVFTGSQNCWITGNNTSISASDFSNDGLLSITAYNSSPSCQGQTNQVVQTGQIKCDGHCLQSGQFPGTYYTCVYVNIPASKDGNFTITGFSDNTCKTTSSQPFVGSGNNICWQISNTQSIVPLKWDSSNKNLYLYTFNDNNQCNGASVLDGVAGIPCDGSCKPSGMVPGTYYTCNYSGLKLFGTYLKPMFAMIALVFMYFYNYILK